MTYGDDDYEPDYYENEDVLDRPGPNWGTLRVTAEANLLRSNEACLLGDHQIRRGHAYAVETWGTRAGDTKRIGYSCTFCVENWGGATQWDVDDDAVAVSVDTSDLYDESSDVDDYEMEQLPEGYSLFKGDEDDPW